MTAFANLMYFTVINAPPVDLIRILKLGAASEHTTTHTGRYICQEQIVVLLWLYMIVD